MTRNDAYKEPDGVDYSFFFFFFFPSLNAYQWVGVPPFVYWDAGVPLTCRDEGVFEASYHHSDPNEALYNLFPLTLSAPS